MYATGRVNGVFALGDRIADGQRAGLDAACHLGLRAKPGFSAPRHTGEAPSHPYPISPHPKQKNFVDFDEDLQLHDMCDAHQEGYDNIELMKRYSTFGMGPSQGKLANMNAVRILARLNGSSIDETGTTTSRPFYTPTPLGHLAGRRFHPMRRTPIHDWHEADEAEIVHAGSWYRAEYYRRDGSSRPQRILSEARNVRRSVGLIDLSTLGKLLVQGPDAVTLLERIYTGRFKRLPVGRQRYAVALDESGIVIEDGVVARLAEERFYVTATSGGVESFYREMQRWALVWGLDVTLVNATSQYAAR